MAADFATAARDALRMLRAHTGHDFWMVTRVRDDDELVILDCLDYAYDHGPGDVLPWSATLDWRMANGLAPRCAPRVADFPAYATAGLTSAMTIGSYLGVPLLRDGEVVGTLSAMHPAPLPDGVVAALPLVETMASLLSAVWVLEEKATAVGRRAARAEVEAHVDPLTQVGNRLAWTKVLVDEENRCRRYGRPACVISLDLDGLKRANDELGHEAGDRLLRSAALVLRRVSRMCDQVARVGGDEFAVLAVEASLGMAVRETSLEDAWRAADEAMYRHKRRRLTERVSAALAAPEVAPTVVRHIDVPGQEQPVASAR